MTDHDLRIDAGIDWTAEAKIDVAHRKHKATALARCSEGQRHNRKDLSC